MDSFDIDIGHGRSLCIEATEKGVDFNSYSPIPSGKVVKVSAKSIHLDINCWKKFNDNIDLVTEGFKILTEDSDTGGEFSLYLGKSLFVRAISSVNCVNIRRYYFDKQDKIYKPGRPGVSFKISEFEELLTYVNDINDVTKIDTVSSCCEIDTQSDCKICNP
jgi:hypothetical protein